jgi:hypothetical protein
VNGLFGLQLEGTRTNLISNSDNLAGAGWNAFGTTTRTGNYVTVGGVSYSRLASLAGAGQGCYHDPIAFTGNGKRAVSLRVRSDGVAGAFAGGIYDSIANTWRLLYSIAISAGGVATATMTVGSLLATYTLADGAYRFLFQATGVVVANPNYGYISNGNIGGVTIASVQISRYQCEDAGYPSSEIPTSGATASRAIDACSFTFNPSAAQCAVAGLSIYEDFIAGRPSNSDPLLVSCCTTVGGTTPGVLNSICIYSNSDGSGTLADSGVIFSAAGQSSSNPSVAYGIGDRVERFLTITPSGVATLSVSVNGGAPSIGASGAALVWPSVFASQVVVLNDSSVGGRDGSFTRRSVRIASGVHTLVQMQQLDLN